jgi:hypothetical protein
MSAKRALILKPLLVLCFIFGTAVFVRAGNQQDEKATGTEAALAFIRKHRAGAFKPGHGLPCLSQWRSMPFELSKELADKWGYALYLGRLTPNLVERLNDADSEPGKTVRLAAAYPDKYKLQITIAPAFSIRTYKDTLPKESFVLDAHGNFVEDKRIFSPVAPDETFVRIGKFEAKMVEKVQKYAPVAIITNGGEYGHNSSGHSARYYEQDPRIVKAKGSNSWQQFLSDQKARQERLVREQVRKVAPNALYIMYAGTGAGHPHRKRYEGWDKWGFSFRRGVSELPAPSLYYAHYNTGFTGDNDLLTQLLNSRAQEIAAGQTFCYPWVSLGWQRRHEIGDVVLYTGWLKCAYTAGALGAVAGYFGAPPYKDAVAQSLPQFLALGRIHAQFSHLDDFLRNSDLLEGPQRHRWSKDLPAYELPTGVAHKRVLARRHRNKKVWLVTAWAADGQAAVITVRIPELDRKVSVEAHPAGHLYKVSSAADKSLIITCLDADTETSNVKLRP